MAIDLAEDFLSDGGALGALMRRKDWSATPLGNPAWWPQSLRTSVSTCLNCAFPILIWWGQDLVKLYNDSYSQILGVKHPQALGAAGRLVWPEIWHVIGPMLHNVMQHGKAARAEDLQLMLERHGYAEECYFSFSYSPIRDESGGVGGVFCPVIETTGRVVGERRLRLLGAVAEATLGMDSAAAACAAAATCIAKDGLQDFPFCAIYLCDGDTARLTGTAGMPPGHMAGAGCVELDAPDAVWPFASDACDMQEVSDLRSRMADVPCGAWLVPPTYALVLPFGTGARPFGFMVAGCNPHRPRAEMRGFGELLGGQIAAAAAAARAREEERRRLAALAELDRAKTAFFSNVSHEFRTPLTLMLGPLQEALAAPDSDPVQNVRPLLETGTRNALRLLRMVNTLLDFSRIEAGRAQARYQPSDLAALTRELAAVFRSAMARAGLRYVVDCPPLSRPVHVDPEMWEKIVLNLLSNAFKFTLAGEVAIALREVGDVALLTVRDTGVGIATDQLPHVFERFHRVPEALGRSNEGSGIGLALVRDLARLHGGDVTAASALGQGSCFTVRIPFGCDHLDAANVSDQPAAAGALGTAFQEEAFSWLDGADPPPLRRTVPDEPPVGPAPAAQDAVTILLADDNADMRDYVRRLLASAGYRVAAVSDGQAALLWLASHGADLVLSDVMMPRMDGLGLVRAIRANPALQDIPVILLSARAGTEAQIEGLELDADDYVTKPFIARELLARVRANLANAAIRRRAADALRRANEILERHVAERTAERDRLWDQSEDLLVLADFNGRLLRLSPSWSSLLGVPTDTLLSLTYQTITHPDDAADALAAVSELRRTGRPIRFESRLLAADGSIRWVSWRLSLDRDGDTLSGIGRDITQDKAVSDEIVATNRELRAQIEERERMAATMQQMQRLEAVGQLTSGVAHDFNNLLTVIMGQLEFLGREISDPGPARRLGTIRSAAKRGADLIAQLLAFSRNQRLDPKPVDLNVAVSGMTDLLRGTLGGTVRLDIKLQPDLWPALVDQGQVELVVLNLAINARDAMPLGGSLIITTDNATICSPAAAAVGMTQSSGPHVPGPGDYVVVTVADTGNGMTPDVLQRAFEPFFTTKGPGKGSGLGLAQVYGFAKQSGGGVRIETRVGEGTAVHVYLPRAAVRPELQAVPDVPGRIEEPRRRVLLVDDDPGVREVTHDMLEMIGYEVTEADGGPAALATLDRSTAFEIVLADFAMPGMNGIELARRIHAIRSDLPVVFVTGYADAKALGDARGRPVLLKPFTLDQLAAALRPIARPPARVLQYPLGVAGR